MSDVAREIRERGLRQLEAEHVEHIRRGLREAEAGQFVDEREVNRVIDRLRRK